MNCHPKKMVRGDYADPSVYRDDDCYYAIFSSFIYNPGLLIWRSENLLDWTPVCHPLDEPIGDIWASTLTKFNGMYYIYFPCDFEIYVITAKTISGPWSKPKAMGLKWAIDPCPLFMESSGKNYLYVDGGTLVELSADGTEAISEKKSVLPPWPIPEEWDIECVAPEGPKPFEKNGFIYMLWAQGGTAGPGTGHMVVMARATNPEGPWEYCPTNPILRAQSLDEKWLSVGHASYIEGLDGHDYLTFHAYEKDYYTLGRQPLLLECEWTDDGWIKVSDDCIEDNGIEDESIENDDKLEYSDSFSKDKLSLLWSFTNEIPKYRVDNGLILNEGTASVNHAFHSYSVETSIDIASVCQNTSAGLTIHYGNDFSCGIATDGITLSTNRNYYSDAPVKIPPNTEKLYLRLKNDNNIITAYYSFDGIKFVKLPWGVNAAHCTHLAYGKFLSLRVGLRTQGEGSAKYDYFTLVSND